MAEFVQKKVEDIRPVLELMKKLQLFNEQEIREITKKLKEHEYKLQRHTKSKEDYLRYIQYQMDLLKLIKQRREKYRISQKKSYIDFRIANKINHLYKEAISKFQDDLRFWIAYMTFCKHVKFNYCVDRMIGRMLSVHQDKPKCWHIAARWEIEENNNFQTAKNFLLRGLHFHPDSQLLYTDVFKLELENALKKDDKSEAKTESDVSTSTDNLEAPNEMKKVFIIYEHAVKRIKDVKFIIELLNIAQGHDKTEKLQNKIASDLVKEYAHEPMMWDTMARRELKGLVQPSLSNDETPMEDDTVEETSLRDCINNCYEVYKTAVKRIKTEEMWSLFIDCMLEINQETDSLPNFRRKLLKNALLLGHKAKKLKEKYYLNWIDMMNTNQTNQDSNTENNKLYEVLCWATEALPESENLWYARLHYIFSNNQEDLAAETFKKAVDILGKKSLPLWQLKLLHMQVKHPEKLEEFFQEALEYDTTISTYIKPIYIEYIVLKKDIDEARKVYGKLCLYPPQCLELHKKMATLELSQPTISLPDARKPHELMTLHFGKNNTDVWMEFIVFEMKHGDATRVSSIYNRAIKMLKPTLADNFITEFSLINANPESLGISL